MSKGADLLRCMECGREIADTERYLVVAGADGVQKHVHTACFNDTTFDPERYPHVTDPESDA